MKVSKVISYSYINTTTRTIVNKWSMHIRHLTYYNRFFAWVEGLPQLIKDDSYLELRFSVYKCVALWELVVGELDAFVAVDVILEVLKYEDNVR